MIISPVTEKQLAIWRDLYEKKGQALRPNRISGRELEAWFCEKYEPDMVREKAFLDVVRENAKEKYPETYEGETAAYELPGRVLVGFERGSGFFQVECRDMERAVPVWDGLFVHRGLSEADLENFVLTGQYIQLAGL